MAKCYLVLQSMWIFCKNVLVWSNQDFVEEMFMKDYCIRKDLYMSQILLCSVN